MGYRKIPNLYKDQRILQFKEGYALEKIHGTSAHIRWNHVDKKVTLFSGGMDMLSFRKCFNLDELQLLFENTYHDNDIVVYGEAYGGKMQANSWRYGKTPRFVAFEAQFDGKILNVKDSHIVACFLDLDFVPYTQIEFTMENINAARDAPSQQAIKLSPIELCIVLPQPKEGVVLRPLIETFDEFGQPIIAKHKRIEERETKTPRDVNDEKLQVLKEAQAIADEWVTLERLKHVLDKFPNPQLSNIPDIITAMIEDIEIEAKGEIVESKAARKAIGKLTAKIFKNYLQDSI